MEERTERERERGGEETKIREKEIVVVLNKDKIGFISPFPFPLLSFNCFLFPFYFGCLVVWLDKRWTIRTARRVRKYSYQRVVMFVFFQIEREREDNYSSVFWFLCCQTRKQTQKNDSKK